ncbi:MAG: branched-chain amino acid aminotransferase [Dehalococcoidales bacterium]
MNINITKVKKSRVNAVDMKNLNFGEVFSDHMLIIDYLNGQWQTPQIVPYGDICFPPSMCAIHYGQVIFEGLKAFYSKHGKINIFRPQKYHQRMNRSCRRLCIPEMDYDLFFNSMVELLKLDKAWVPHQHGYSLYIRPFIFATDSYIGVRVSENYRFMIILSPVAAYYKEGLNPVRLITSGEYVRAAKGGLGEAKTPANYAASLLPGNEAHKKGFTQVLWLDAAEHKYIEEVGTMNICFVIDHELVTPPLDGTILEGTTRDSVLRIARDSGIKVNERHISIDEVLSASKSGKLSEVFGTGTAAVISPVGEIQHLDTLIKINDGKIGTLSQQFYDEVTAIQYGEKPDKYGWIVTL